MEINEVNVGLICNWSTLEIMLKAKLQFVEKSFAWKNKFLPVFHLVSPHYSSSWAAGEGWESGCQGQQGSRVRGELAWQNPGPPGSWLFCIHGCHVFIWQTRGEEINAPD